MTKTPTTDPEKRAERVAGFFGCPFCGIPRVFGILNVTPDSFSDGGLYAAEQDAVAHALRMLEEGAAAIDVGAESTRPGAAEVPADEEAAMLLPVIRHLKELRPDCIVSVDTRKAVVADAVLQAGADIVNDVSGLGFDPQMADVIARHGAGLVLTHSRGTPETMRNAENLVYEDLPEQISGYFEERIGMALRAGIRRECIVLDPGIGFAKTVSQDLTLVRHADLFRKHGLPLFYGISRKSFLGVVCDRDKASERDFATAGALARLTEQRVDFVRVHAVRASLDAMRAFFVCGNETDWEGVKQWNGSSH